MATHRLSAIVAATAIAMLSSAADAVVYQGYAANFANGGSTSAPTTYTYSDLFSSATSTTGSATGGSAYASGSTVSPGTTIAYAEVDYSFQIVGPSTSFAIPVAVQASGYVDGSGLYYIALDQFRVSFDSSQGPDGTYYPGINQSLESASFSPFKPGNQPFSYSNTIMMPVNSNINVSIATNINVGSYSPTDGTASSATAFLDPIFSLVGNPSGYSIVGVPGATTAAAVPEPESWALLVIGLGMVGGSLRRRPIAHRNRAL